MKCLVLILALAAATPLAAEGYGFKDGDTRFDFAALQDRLSGQTLTFYDDGRSNYLADGRYTFTYADQGGVAYGYWRIDDEGAVCVEFLNGFDRCDLYVMNGARLILLDTRGNRYPVRPE